MDTIRTGAACLTSEDAVRLDTFFACVYHEMKQQVAAIRAKQALDEEIEKQRVAAAIAAAIAGEEGGGGDGGENAAGGGTTSDEAHSLSDSVTRKKKNGGDAKKGSSHSNDNNKKKKAKENKKKGKEKKGKKGKAANDDEKVIVAQTPALFLPTVGVVPPDRRYAPSAVTQLVASMRTWWTTVLRRRMTTTRGTSASPSSSSSTVARQHPSTLVHPLSNKQPVYLTPTLADPFLTHRVYFRCGPPPAPERPFITFVTPHTVALTWYNPAFDGIAPIYYRLQMENVSRNFHEWQYLRMPGGPSENTLYLVALDGMHHFEDDEEDRRRRLNQGYAYYCIRDTKYVVRDLPSGIACRFRVQAYNPAGWSVFSLPSDYVTPGEEQTPLPPYMLWRRLTQSGSLGILDRLKRHPHHADEQREGMRRLAAFGNNNHGFVKTAVALTVAQHCVDNLRRFADDPDVVQYTLQTMVWTLVGGKYERKVRYYYTQNPLPLSIDEILLMKEIRKRRSSIADAVTKAAADAADLAANAVANAAASGEQLRYQEQRRQQARGRGAQEMPTELKSDLDEIQMQSLLGILTLLWQRWRHHSGVVNALQGLRGAASMSKYLGSVGLVRTHEMYQPIVNFPPPESEKDGDDWSDDDEEDELEKAALDDLMRERQAALQSQEKQAAKAQQVATEEATKAAATTAAKQAATGTTSGTATGTAKVTSKKGHVKIAHPATASDTKASGSSSSSTSGTAATAATATKPSSILSPAVTKGKSQA